MYQLKITLPCFQQLVEQLQSHSRNIISYPTSICRTPDCVELLVHSINDERTATLNAPENPYLLVTSDPHLLPTLKQSYPAPFAALALGLGNNAGQVAALFQLSNETYPINKIKIVGTGLPLLDLTSPIEQAAPTIPKLEAEIWSRTIGALGQENWRKLTELNLQVAGAGRSGEVVLEALVCLGAKHLTCYDPDKLSIGNIGEMANVSLNQSGLPKAKLLARNLPTPNGVKIKAIDKSILSISALSSVKQADFIISCVDNATARLALTLAAKLFLIPVIDMGSAIFNPATNNNSNPATDHRRMNTDVRLIEPERCLVCSGGITGLSDACKYLLANLHSETTNWRSQRAGSLRSLNLISTGLSLRLLEDYASGRITNSCWLMLDYNTQGLPTLQTINFRDQSNRDCPICRILTGRGDSGLALIPEVLKRLV